MWRAALLLSLTGSLLVGSVALAQQGLILEPWRQAPAIAPVVPAPPPAPARPSELLPVPHAQAPARAIPAPAESPPPPAKWSPPVVQLLVDPWAHTTSTPPSPHPRWMPPPTEIIDPWAEAPPRIAAGPPPVERATIF